MRKVTSFSGKFGLAAQPKLCLLPFWRHATSSIEVSLPCVFHKHREEIPFGPSTSWVSVEKKNQRCLFPLNFNPVLFLAAFLASPRQKTYLLPLLHFSGNSPAELSSYCTLSVWVWPCLQRMAAVFSAYNGSELFLNSDSLEIQNLSTNTKRMRRGRQKTKWTHNSS